MQSRFYLSETGRTAKHTGRAATLSDALATAAVLVGVDGNRPRRFEIHNEYGVLEMVFIQCNGWERVVTYSRDPEPPPCPQLVVDLNSAAAAYRTRRRKPK